MGSVLFGVRLYNRLDPSQSGEPGVRPNSVSRGQWGGGGAARARLQQ